MRCLWVWIFFCIATGSSLAKEFIVGVCCDNPPFSFQKKGVYVGFEIDLIKAIAKKRGMDIRLKDMDFSSLIPAIISGHLDLAIAFVAPTPQRAEIVDFSVPYYQDLPIVLTQKPVADNQSPLQDLPTIGVQLGTLHLEHLKTLKKNNSSLSFQIKIYNRLSDMAQDLKQGRIQGGVLDEASAQPVQQAFGFTSTALSYKTPGAAIMLPKGSPLTLKMNTALQELKEEDFFATLKKKWLSSDQTSTSSFFIDNALFILGGLKVTLFYTFSSLAGGIFIAVLLTFLRFSSFLPAQFFVKTYVSVFRGIPLLLQLWLIYFGIGSSLSVWQAGLLAFSLNSGAYLSEILRAGIQSIDRGQWDAGYVLGLARWRILKDIVLPQALQKQIPSLVNEAADLLKESALVSTIAEADLMRRATLVAGQTFDYWMPYLLAGLCYYLMISLLSFLARFSEKYLHKKYRL